MASPGKMILLVCYRPLARPSPAQSEANKGLHAPRERLPIAGGRLIAARSP